MQALFSSHLAVPSQTLLASYTDALENGWEPALNGPPQRSVHLQAIHDDPGAFLARCDDPHGTGVVVQADGSTRPRLPSKTFWIVSDEAFAGTLSLRWPKEGEMPPWCLGHIGWHVVPWHQGKNLAPKALVAVLPIAKSLNLPFLDLSILYTNRPSIRAAEKAGATHLGPTKTEPTNPEKGLLGTWRLWT